MVRGRRGVLQVLLKVRVLLGLLLLDQGELCLLLMRHSFGTHTLLLLLLWLLHRSRMTRWFQQVGDLLKALLKISSTLVSRCLRFVH